MRPTSPSSGLRGRWRTGWTRTPRGHVPAMARTRGGGKRPRRGPPASATRPATAPLTAEQLPLAEQAANLLRSNPASVVATEIAPYWRPLGRVRRALIRHAREQGTTIKRAKVELLGPTLWESDSDRPRTAAENTRIARIIAGDPATDQLVARPFIRRAERDLLAERPRLPILLLAGERRRAQQVPLPEETLPEMESDILPGETATILPEGLYASADALTRLIAAEERERRLHAIEKSLPPRTRECLMLFLSGLTVKEIAATMGVSKATVRVYFHQIRQAIAVVDKRLNKRARPNTYRVEGLTNRNRLSATSTDGLGDPTPGRRLAS